MDNDTGKKQIESVRSNQILKEFSAYLNRADIKQKLTCSFDFGAFETDLQKGLYFKSDIPEESGLGSSGALVAAAFDRYTNINTSDLNLPGMRECLGLSESFFHGTSSGIDPLVSYLKSPVLIKNNDIHITFNLPVEESLRKSGMFLVYFRKNGRTGELVNNFNNKCKSDPGYLHRITREYIPVNDECIMSLTNNYNAGQFYSSLRKITSMQLEIFDEMIPGNIVPLINYGLENDLFYLKLCGSGGGGYFLGFTKNIVKTESYFKEMGYQILIYSIPS